MRTYSFCQSIYKTFIEPSIKLKADFVYKNEHNTNTVWAAKYEQSNEMFKYKANMFVGIWAFTLMN